MANDKHWVEQEILAKVLVRCQSYVREESIRLGARMHYVYRHRHDDCIRPKIMELSQRKESAPDCQVLGGCCESYHNVCMEPCGFPYAAPQATDHQSDLSIRNERACCSGGAAYRNSALRRFEAFRGGEFAKVAFARYQSPSPVEDEDH